MERYHVHFKGGSYGNFLILMLSNTKFDLQSTATDYHYPFNENKWHRSHEEVCQVHKNNIKIAYDESDIDLIFRLKWSKTPWDMKTQLKEWNGRSTDADIKKIVTASWYKLHLHEQQEYWHRPTRNTFFIKFKTFWLPKEQYIGAWQRIFTGLNLPFDPSHCESLYEHFNKTQSVFLKPKTDWISQSIDLCDAYLKNPVFDKSKYSNSTDYMIDLLTSSAQPATASTGNE